MELARWLDRFTETANALREALDNSGTKEAAICAVLACMGATDREELAADMHAIAVFYPALLRKETSSFLSLAFDIASVALSIEQEMPKVIDDMCVALDERGITEAWQNSVWRKPESKPACV
ncbi:hypothetical protein FM996_15285 [Methylosinus sporium]|uniref:Uncharacterized protein n=1 Tax=Methylosinus sporium TaxID=428 RepID=A0A549SMG5_METSR|nr:hypothetical protein [Methylosinus sporium]TRL30823.1 hypothetical protein FM996_15285 [Methylosinus sporium]